MPRWTVKATGFAMRSDPNEIEADKDAPYLRGWGAGATSPTAPGFRRSDPITTLPSSLLSGGWRGRRRVRGPGVALLDLSSFLFLCVGSAHAPSLSPPSSGLTMACGTKRMQPGMRREWWSGGWHEQRARGSGRQRGNSAGGCWPGAGLPRPVHLTGTGGHCGGTSLPHLCGPPPPPPLSWRFLKRLSSSQG